MTATFTTPAANNAATTAETLSLIKQAIANPSPTLNKAFTVAGSATTGLTYYDLEEGSKKLFPVLTPLRNRIPRVSGKGGLQANWRAVTGINTGALSAGVSEGRRGGVVATQTQDYVAVYRGLGLEDSVTFEAAYAGQGLDDIYGLAAQNLLSALMIQEEAVLLGGLGTWALGTTPTPVTSAVASGGSLQSGTYKVYCLALTLDGLTNASVTGGVPTQIARANADGTSESYGGGSGAISASSSVATAAGGQIKASVTPVRGALGYAWFWGTGGAGNEKLGAITTISSVLISADPAGTQLAGAAGLAGDNSQNALVFDGLLSQVAKTGSNAYLATQPVGTPGTGTPLTADGAGGIVEIDAALKSFWDNYRLSPTRIWVSSQEAVNIARKVLTSGATPAQRFVFETTQNGVAGGVIVRGYYNKYAGMGDPMPVMVHPNLPAGTILFDSDSVPYPLAGIGNILQVKTRQDYYQVEWPMKRRKREYGVYVDEVLQNYFPPAFGMITNIANG